MKIAVTIRKDSPQHWEAWVPAMPGCMARGHSQEECRAKIHQAIRSYLASWDAPDASDIDEDVCELCEADASAVLH